MDFFRRFSFLVCAPAFDADELEGVRVQQIVAEVERIGFEVVRTRRVEDAELAIRTDAAIGCMIVDWGKRGLEGKPASLIALARKRGLEMPIILLVRRQRLENIPVDVLNQVDGYVFLAEETPEFIAKNLVSRLKQYAETLKTPFFGELVDYAEEGNQLWTCPGHNGGIFYSRSPIGRIFVEHLGEAVFRDDIDNSVLEMGDLLVHEGPALKAQKEAAKIFGAERTYFVLNGTSASNKIVLSALVAEDDLVLFDRNNHKAAHHGGLFLGGGIPIFLETDRNPYGLIGPIDHEALDEERIREKIRRNPLVKDPNAWKRERPFRAAVIQQCSYDGTIYSAETILAKIGHLCDYILFDEAWAGFLKFHPLFKGRFAMGLDGLHDGHPGIIATQSTHKQLASFSQASQIHVKDSHIKGQRRRVEHRRFNETFLLHASTSPFYPLFASLDVGAQMIGPVRRGAVGRHDPAGHRAAQEAARHPPRVRGARERPGAPLVLRPLRARPGGGRHHHHGLGGCADRRAGLRRAALGIRAGGRLARLPPCGDRLCDDRPQQADSAHPGLRPPHRRL
ncbi:Ornithine decarboxylase (EC 4.1.1.17) [Azospirillum melinis]